MVKAVRAYFVFVFIWMSHIAFAGQLCPQSFHESLYYEAMARLIQATKHYHDKRDSFSAYQYKIEQAGAFKLFFQSEVQSTLKELADQVDQAKSKLDAIQVEVIEKKAEWDRELKESKVEQNSPE
jgi:hypothetical protein